ncbi:MAG: amidohydrolase family protein [Oscillospiraceae bacterium]
MPVLKAIKGQIVYAPDTKALAIHENSWVVSQDGVVVGIFKELPKEYASAECEDYGDRLIIPGLVDLHVHAPQYAFRGTGMDLELLDWLNTYTFPEEGKYGDLAYADRAYSMFVNDLKNSATTRAVVFATIHTDATLMLMDKLEASGVSAFVGKVNMDRNSPDFLREDTENSLANTKDWLSRCKKSSNIKPILTPRFTPSCTDELMRGLKKLQEENNLCVQSHLSENAGEIAWVKELCPNTSCYGEAYEQFGLFGGEVPTIMAHCVHSTADEIELMRKNGVFVAHCPQSNTNLSSGIAPVREYLEKGVKVGLGSDVAGGANISILRAMADAIQVSKLRWRLVDEGRKPLTLAEALYIATKGGGEFFGKVGSFEKGYAMDAVVLSEELLPHPQEMSICDRLERIIYMSDDRTIRAKYKDGKKIK